MTRQSDYLTNANEEINFLIHIPSNEYQHFSKVVKCWKYNITVSQVNYQKTVQPNGKVDSIFNRIFIAASNQSINADPTILYQKSGMITGTRVMITRKLWTKSRIKHRMNNYIACAPVIKALLPSKSTIII
jgi:hypothetical protein